MEVNLEVISDIHSAALNLRSRWVGHWGLGNGLLYFLSINHSFQKLENAIFKDISDSCHKATVLGLELPQNFLCKYYNDLFEKSFETVRILSWEATDKLL